MPMTIAELGQLKKLLTLATSENDNEALASWRAATRLIVKHGYTWSMVIERTVTVIQEVTPVAGGDSAGDLDDLFDEALRGADGTFRDTILSIQVQYQSRGFLTPRQREVVEDAAERTVDRRPDGRVR